MDYLNNKHYLVRVRAMINTQSKIKALLYFFTFFVVFTPVDVFSMKKASLFLLLVLSVKYIELFPTDGLHKTISMFGFWLTTISILISSILTLDFVSNVVQGYMGWILLLFYLIEGKKIDFSIIFENVLVLLALFTVCSAILDFLGIIPMYSNGILNWMSELRIAYVGKQSKLATGYMIFVKTSPLLVLLLPAAYQKKKYITVVLCMTAILISGTRANIIIGFVVLTSAILFKMQKTLFEKLFLIVSITVIIYFIVDGGVFDVIGSMFDVKAEDDAVRKKILHNIISGFCSNPISFLIGSGFSSPFYNEARQGLSTLVELSYWNLLRQVGIFIFIPMLIGYLYPAYRLIKIKDTRPIAIACLGYLLIAYTNPLLYSTTGILGLLYMFYLVYKNDSNGHFFIIPPK